MNVGRSWSARVVTGAFAIMLIASACTFGEETTDDGGGNGDGGDGGVTLTMWAHRSKSFNQALRDAAAAYTAENPNVTIELETFA
jgi:ABC-type glycerol-3-phosphate transport system substrate-binding protein